MPFTFRSCNHLHSEPQRMRYFHWPKMSIISPPNADSMQAPILDRAQRTHATRRASIIQSGSFTFRPVQKAGLFFAYTLGLYGRYSAGFSGFSATVFDGGFAALRRRRFARSASASLSSRVLLFDDVIGKLLAKSLSLRKLLDICPAP